MLIDTTNLQPEPGFSAPPGADLPAGYTYPKKPRTPVLDAQEAPTQAPKRPTVPDRSRWESGDHYPGVRFLIPRTPYRVVADPQGYSWILQKRQGANAWFSWKFFARKQRLATVLRELVPAQTFKEVEPQIAALPV
jgi:hypothetical protein